LVRANPGPIHKKPTCERLSNDAKDENHPRARQYWQNLAPLPVKLFTSDYIFDETEFSMGGVAPREAL